MCFISSGAHGREGASKYKYIGKSRKSVELGVTALCISDVTSYKYLHY